MCPGESAGGPAFISAVMAPCPWHRLLPTGGVYTTEASISEWIKAGAAAVGLGSKLISNQAVKDKDYDSIAVKTAQCVGWVQSARGVSLFSGVEHIGLYAHRSDPAALSAWYEKTFELKSNEGNSSFFVAGPGAGRIEIPKASAAAQVRHTRQQLRSRGGQSASQGHWVAGCFQQTRFEIRLSEYRRPGRKSRSSVVAAEEVKLF